MKKGPRPDKKYPSLGRPLDKNGNWHGGEWKRHDGYIFVTLGGGVRRLKHRVVMEEYLGRILLRKEIVHHKNGDRSDNQISNLEIMSQQEHAKIHYSLRKLNDKNQFL